MKTKVTILGSIEALEALASAGKITPKQIYKVGEALYVGETFATYSELKPTSLGNNVVFLESTINQLCDVSAGTNQTSVNIKIPANKLADGDAVEIMQKLIGYKGAGTPTEDRFLKVDDTVTPVSTLVNDDAIMPTSVQYAVNVFPYYLRRIGTHLYWENRLDYSPNHTALSIIWSQTIDLTQFKDLGTPDFTKEITISLTHTLSAASAGAYIKCIYSQAKMIKNL